MSGLTAVVSSVSRLQGQLQSLLRYPAICDAFLASAGEAGYPVVDALNTDVVEGFGRIDTNIGNGRRASTAVAFAQAGRRRGNLDLLSEAIAARIVIENGRAKGVEIIRRVRTRQSGRSAKSFCAAERSTRRSS